MFSKVIVDEEEKYEFSFEDEIIDNENLEKSKMNEFQKNKNLSVKICRKKKQKMEISDLKISSVSCFQKSKKNILPVQRHSVLNDVIFFKIIIF